jgi:hypothetical protein
MFESRLILTSQYNERLSLVAITLVPNSGYTAGKAYMGAPQQIRLGKYIYPMQLHLEYSHSEGPDIQKKIQHEFLDLDLRNISILKAFVMQDDTILGSTESLIGITPIDGKLAALDFLKSDSGVLKPVLTPELCQGVIIHTAPVSWNYASPTQRLSELGITDAVKANSHRAAIYQRMKSIGFEALITAIATGPEIDISASRDSLFNNVI